MPRLTLNSKFFGKPNGTKVPAKQSTLSFSTKSNTKIDAPASSSAKENGDTEMKDENSDREGKPKSEKVEEVEEDTTKEKVKNGLPPLSLLTTTC